MNRTSLVALMIASSALACADPVGAPVRLPTAAVIARSPGGAAPRYMLRFVSDSIALGDGESTILEICDVFRVRVLDVTHRTITIEGTGTPVKLEALLELLRDFGIVELSRTGRIALARGDRGIKERSARLRAVAGSEQEWTGGGV